MPKLRFQYTIRTLLLLFAVFAILMGLAVKPLHDAMGRVNTQRKLTALGATLVTEPCDVGFFKPFLPEEAAREIIEIDFYDHEPTDVDLELLHKCPHLRRLYLSGGKYSDFGFRNVADLHELERLIVNGNAKIDDKSLIHLSGLRNLKELTIYPSSITGAGFRKTRLLNNLESLCLDCSLVSDDSIVILENFTKLRKLELVGTKITDQGLRHLGNINSLEELALDRTNIDGSGLSFLRSLTHLRDLSLSYAKVTDSGLKHLRGLSNLETLYLFYTNITDASIPHLMALANLRQLHLQATRISKEGAMQLNTLPKLEELLYSHQNELRNCPSPASLDNHSDGKVNPEE